MSPAGSIHTHLVGALRGATREGDPLLLSLSCWEPWLLFRRASRWDSHPVAKGTRHVSSSGVCPASALFFSALG